MWIVGGLRQLEFALRLLEILRGDPIVVGVLAITPGDHVKGALVLPHGLGIVFRGEAYVGGPGQCGCIVGAGVGTGMLVDVERATGERLRLFEFGVGGLILTVEHSEGEIRAGGGDIHVGLGIHARMFEDPQRFVEFIDCLPPAVRLAEQHRPVVVEGGKTAIVRPVGAACRVECLFEQILGLVEIAGGPLRCGRVDERGGPGLGAFEAHTQCQLDGALDDPLVLLMTPLRTVESHRLVEHGEQTRIVLRVLGVGHRLLQILVGLVFGGMRGEHRIESSKELVGVKAGARV